MRFLFSQAEKVTMIRKGLRKNLKQEDLLGSPVEIFYAVLHDVAFLFLSPLLAIAVWLVLFQAGTTSTFTLTAVSFVIGLVTQEAGKSLVAFAKRMLLAFDTSLSETGLNPKRDNLESRTGNDAESETEDEKGAESETEDEKGAESETNSSTNHRVT